MAILIPNLNLPKGCGDCMFCEDYHYGVDRCTIDKSLYFNSKYEYTRHPKCPLIELNTNK